MRLVCGEVRGTEGNDKLSGGSGGSGERAAAVQTWGHVTGTVKVLRFCHLKNMSL